LVKFKVVWWNWILVKEIKIFGSYQYG